MQPQPSVPAIAKGDIYMRNLQKMAKIDPLRKIRNTLNVALGTQMGRTYPSAQAIEKWKADIEFLDKRLKVD